MGKQAKRNTFNYNVDRKKLKKKMLKKYKPKIECVQIRKAWDTRKTAKQNMKDMGLSYGTKGVLPLTTKEDEAEDLVIKPYVIREMEEEASQTRQDTTTCSTDLIEFVQHMIREHGEEDYKAMARDEKNYYQDTPKQIRRKVELYKRCHAAEYAAFLNSLPAQTSS